MSTNVSGNANGWEKTRNTTEDITNATVTKGCEAVDAVKSGANWAEKKTVDAAVSVKDFTVEKTDEGIDAASAKTSEGVDALKTGAANAWEQTKDTAGNVTNSAINMGSGLVGAVKSGAEAGWNKARGTSAD